MKLNENWLRQWVSPDLDIQGIGHALTMAGLELDSIESLSVPLKKVVVGQIESLDPHPDADRLRVCQVNVGSKARLQIVCGAANAAAGMKVPVALVGAELPGGLVIKRAALRGVESAGMLCASAELGLAEESSGLLELPADAPLGQSIVQFLELDDHALEVDLTPNRGDCLSIAGIARELAAVAGARLKPLRIKPVAPGSKSRFPVTVEAQVECPRYAGRVIEGIDVLAKTPVWMSERLRRCGLRSIGPVVDVTNYVLLELGQPMHAFDLDKLHQGIVVRQADTKQQMTLLDGQSIKVPRGALLIADHKGPLALAGIMGGAHSAVSDSTTNIFLESAYFSPDAIAGRARSLGLHTDSSHRFERGVDPGLQRQAIERATALLLEIVGGKPGPVIEVKQSAHLPKRKAVKLRYQRLLDVLGVTLPRPHVQRILKRLGLTVTVSADGWKAVPPGHRFDIEREEDLIEEVARLYGYDAIVPAAPRASLAMKPAPETEIGSRLVGSCLTARGYQEVVSYSFVDPGLQAMLVPERDAPALSNPIAADLSVMRASLWPGLVAAVRHNLNRQQYRVRLFETGRRFEKIGKKTVEIPTLAGAVSGPVLAKQWGVSERNSDFFDTKADLESVLDLAKGAEFEFRPGQHAALHPGQTAELIREGCRVGWIGKLHPAIEAKLDISQPLYLFEVDISALQAVKIAEFQEISRYPSIQRDLAIVVDLEVPAESLLRTIRKSAGKLLVNLELFDDYRGEGIDSGRKSLALGLTLQDSSRTLKEVEVDTVITRVVAALQSEHGGQLRQ